MELEVSYNENYCLEGRAERQRGATDRDDGGGQAVWDLRLMLLKRAIMPIYYAKIMPPHTHEWG